MALPVAQIMNQLQRGVREERIDVDDDDEEAMANVIYLFATVYFQMFP